jgi:hypothetical protein
MTVIRHFLSWEIIILGQRLHKTKKQNSKWMLSPCMAPLSNCC